jgi:alkaline phosphatase
MDTASASSIVTDSAAGSSSWGGGVRVPNGSLNVSETGENFLPIWQKFKKAGKKAGCVTTVPITHATPAGFCVNTASRNSQPEIAELYLQLGFDVLMGGGNDYFAANKRKDQKDLYAAYAAKGYQVVQEKSSMHNCSNSAPILGVFDQDALPYDVDRNQNAQLQQKIPTLAEMAQKAIDTMKDHDKGFVLQIESGKVDWAAHANDIAGLIHEQIQFEGLSKYHGRCRQHIPHGSRPRGYRRQGN